MYFREIDFNINILAMSKKPTQNSSVSLRQMINNNFRLRLISETRKKKNQDKFYNSKTNGLPIELFS